MIDKLYFRTQGKKKTSTIDGLDIEESEMKDSEKSRIYEIISNVTSRNKVIESHNENILIYKFRDEMVIEIQTLNKDYSDRILPVVCYINKINNITANDWNEIVFKLNQFLNINEMKVDENVLQLFENSYVIIQKMNYRSKITKITLTVAAILIFIVIIRILVFPK